MRQGVSSITTSIRMGKRSSFEWLVECAHTQTRVVNITKTIRIAEQKVHAQKKKRTIEKSSSTKLHFVLKMLHDARFYDFYTNFAIVRVYTGARIRCAQCFWIIWLIQSGGDSEKALHIFHRDKFGGASWAGATTISLFHFSGPFFSSQGLSSRSFTWPIRYWSAIYVRLE